MKALIVNSLKQTIMSKEKDGGKKAEKKAPIKTLKEKRADKAAKKEERRKSS
jgi:hypothetical protein